MKNSWSKPTGVYGVHWQRADRLHMVALDTVTSSLFLIVSSMVSRTFRTKTQTFQKATMIQWKHNFKTVVGTLSNRLVNHSSIQTFWMRTITTTMNTKLWKLRSLISHQDLSLKCVSLANSQNQVSSKEGMLKRIASKNICQSLSIIAWSMKRLWLPILKTNPSLHHQRDKMWSMSMSLNQENISWKKIHDRTQMNERIQS